jgi:hypothetical protein
LPPSRPSFALGTSFLPFANPCLADARAIAHAALKGETDAQAAAVLLAIREAGAAGAKSLRQIAVALNSRGIATARGANGKWRRRARVA